MTPGRVAIVTGGASGIGRATAQLLQEQGSRVAVLDLSADGDAGEFPVDISNEEAVQATVEQVQRSLGPIDILVNAAGMPSGGPIEADSYVETWRRTMDVNLTGAMLMVRACLANLSRNGSGRIVNVASTEALGAARGTSPYTASKHGLLGFTRALAVDLGRRGVTANCVCPGPILTGMTEAIPSGDRDAFARRRVPLGRYGRPEEVAYVIASLTAVEASYVNGAVIAVDGGMTASAG